MQMMHLLAPPDAYGDHLRDETETERRKIALNDGKLIQPWLCFTAEVQSARNLSGRGSTKREKNNTI